MYIDTTNELVDTMMVLLELTEDSDKIKCKYYLDLAGDVINNIRKTPLVEEKYHNVQIQMAIELYNKQGVEGQTSHSENGISRGYKSTAISDDLLTQVTPRVTTPQPIIHKPTPL